MAFCGTLEAALDDSHPAAGLHAALTALLSSPEHLAPAPVAMASQMFPVGGPSAAAVRGPPGVTTQAAARHPGASAGRPNDRAGPRFSCHAAVPDILPEGCEDAEPFLSMHVAQALQVLMHALGGLRQLRLLPDAVKRACGNACRACVQVLEAVYNASDKLCAPPRSSSFCGSATPPPTCLAAQQWCHLLS